jgi:hypothetical protein
MLWKPWVSRRQRHPPFSLGRAPAILSNLRHYSSYIHPEREDCPPSVLQDSRAMAHFLFILLQARAHCTASINRLEFIRYAYDFTLRSSSILAAILGVTSVVRQKLRLIRYWRKRCSRRRWGRLRVSHLAVAARVRFKRVQKRTER